MPSFYASPGIGVDCCVMTEELIYSYPEDSSSRGTELNVWPKRVKGRKDVSSEIGRLIEGTLCRDLSGEK